MGRGVDMTLTGAVASEEELRRRIEKDPDDATALDALGLLLLPAKRTLLSIVLRRRSWRARSHRGTAPYG